MPSVFKKALKQQIKSPFFFDILVCQTISVTYQDGLLSIYLNGQLDSTLAVSGSVVERSDDTTMGNSPVGGSFFNGGLDEVYIYNRVLSASEIGALAGNI